MDVSGRESIELGGRGLLVQIQSSRPLTPNSEGTIAQGRTRTYFLSVRSLR